MSAIASQPESNRTTDMDTRALSDAEPLRASPAHWLILSSLRGRPGSWKALFKDMQQSYSPYAGLADSRDWRDRLKRHVAKGATATYDFLDNQLPDDFRRSVCDRNEAALAQRNQGIDPPATSTWFLFERVAENLKREDGEHRIGVFLDLLVGLGDREMDFEETIMWMLCAYLERVRLQKNVHLL